MGGTHGIAAGRFPIRAVRIHEALANAKPGFAPAARGSMRGP